MSLTTKNSKTFCFEEQAVISKVLQDAGGLIFQLQYSPDKGITCFPFASVGLLDFFEVEEELLKHDASPILKAIHPDDVEAFYLIIQKSMNTLESWDYDFRVLSKLDVKWFKGHGKPERLSDGSYLCSGYMTDITNQKEIEIDLYESKQRLQLALENTKDGLWDWNVKTDKVYYSKESKAILGYKQDEELEYTADDWNNKVHSEDVKSYYTDMHRHFDGETPYYFNEHRILCKDGYYKWILDRGKVIERDFSGNPVRVIGTHTDISIQKQKEYEARTKMDIIEDQNNRLTNFAHIVSHNLRSHSGNFEMLLDLVDEANSSEEKLEMVDHLKKVSESLSETIVHLNKVVSIQTNLNKGLEKINLSNYIAKTVDVLKAEVKKKNANIVNKVFSDVFVDHNPAYLESVLLNLISNGIKYKHPERDPEITLHTFLENGKLALKISDNGIGIDLKKHGENLFGMYKTFHGNPDAKGIGLFITKNQIEGMGGTIEVESEVNVGTSFKIIFK